jgi:hypothetical protein
MVEFLSAAGASERRPKGAEMNRKLLGLVAAVVILGGCYLEVSPAGVSVSIPPPRLTYITGTPIQVVAGMANVFFYGGYYWRVANGVWYRSSSYNGGWAVYHSVPSAFLRIPPGHPAHGVVRYHPQYHRNVRRAVPTPKPHYTRPSKSKKKPK